MDERLISEYKDEIKQEIAYMEGIELEPDSRIAVEARDNIVEDTRNQIKNIEKNSSK